MFYVSGKWLNTTQASIQMPLKTFEPKKIFVYDAKIKKISWFLGVYKKLFASVHWRGIYSIFCHFTNTNISQTTQSNE